MPRAALLFLIPFLMAQAPGTTPAQPFPNHEEPPSGWYCVPSDTAERTRTDAHACDCRGMIEDEHPRCTTTTEDENGNPVEQPAGESNRCKVFCHKDHCTCERLCKSTN